MDKLALAREIRRVAKLTGQFTLRSGAVSDTYFDKYQFESSPRLLRAIAEQMALLVPADTQILCGLELGGVPVVTMLSQVTGLPAAFIRKEPKAYGTAKFAEGPPLEGRSLLLVEDVVSSGGQIIDSSMMMREAGCVVKEALCVIDRRPADGTVLHEAGIELHALLTMAEIEAA